MSRGVDFINIFARTELEAFFDEWRLENGEERLAKSKQFLANFDQILALILLEKLNGEFFAQTPFAGNFSFGEKSWMKSIQGEGDREILDKNMTYLLNGILKQKDEKLQFTRVSLSELVPLSRPPLRDSLSERSRYQNNLLFR
jgi:hypothetical protein